MNRPGLVCAGNFSAHPMECGNLLYFYRWFGWDWWRIQWCPHERAIDRSWAPTCFDYQFHHGRVPLVNRLSSSLTSGFSFSCSDLSCGRDCLVEKPYSRSAVLSLAAECRPFAHPWSLGASRLLCWLTTLTVLLIRIALVSAATIAFSNCSFRSSLLKTQAWVAWHRLDYYAGWREQFCGTLSEALRKAALSGSWSGSKRLDCRFWPRNHSLLSTS